MSNQTEFKNENLTVSLTKKPGLIVVLDISIAPNAVNAAYTKAIKAINKEVSIPGFRKGKAPDQFIIQSYGKQLQGEWREILLQESFQEALALSNTHPFRKNAVRSSGIRELSRDKEAKFTVEFEVNPEVPSIDLESIRLHHPKPVPITETDVDKVIDNLRFYYAEWKDITDRPIQEGDYVDLDIDKVEEPQDRICDGMRFVISKGKTADWMYNLVVGLNVNDSVEGMSEREQDEPETSEFTPTLCRITVKSIKEANLPEVDDALALRMGLPNLELLRDKVKDDLINRAEQENHEVLRKQLDEMLLEKYHFEVPASLLEEEKEERISNAINRLEREQETPEFIEQRRKELEQKVPIAVEQSYRIFFLLLTFAQKIGVELTKEEVSEELSNQMMRYGQSLSAKQAQEMESRVAQQIFLRRARDYIIENAKHA